MVRAFIPQGRNENIDANTINPPQGLISAPDTPPEDMQFEDGIVMQFENNIIMEYET